MNKKQIIIAIAAVIVLAIGIAFSRNSFYPMMSWSTGSVGSGVAGSPPMMGSFDGFDRAESAPAEFPVKSSDSIVIQNGSQADVGQFIIKRGEISMRVTDANDATTKISDLATGFGGSILTKSLNKDINDQLSGYITIQVAADKFDPAFSGVKALGTEVTSESVSAEDVTEQVIDIEVRLKNARAEEQSYLAVLAKAETVEDILAVQQYLYQVRQTIEQLEAQQKYLSTQTTYSVITVFITEETVVKIGGQEFRPWQAAVDAVQMVISGFQAFIIALIQVLIIGVAILIPASLIYLIARALYRKFKK